MAAKGLTVERADHTKESGKKNYTIQLKTTQIKLKGSPDYYTYFNQSLSVRS